MSKQANTVKHTIRQSGFTLIEIIAVIAIMGILTTIAVPALGKLINQNRTKAASALLHDNLRQARYASKARSNSVVVFCAVQANLNAKQSCVGNNNRARFSNGWQWFVDTDGDFQYNEAAGDTLLGNTYEVDLHEMDIAVLNSPTTQPRILRNRVVLNGGRATIVDPNGNAITPEITFTDKQGRKSTVTFDVTGRTTLRHHH